MRLGNKLTLIYLVDQIVKYDPSFEKSDRSKILKIYALSFYWGFDSY